MTATTGTTVTAGPLTALEDAYEKALAKRGWRRGDDKTLGLCEMARAALLDAWMESADGFGMEFGAFVGWLICGEGMRIGFTLEQVAVVAFVQAIGTSDGTRHWLRALRSCMHGFAFDVLARFSVLKMDGAKHPENEAREWLANKVGCTEKTMPMSVRGWVPRTIEGVSMQWALYGLLAGNRPPEGGEA